MLINFKLKKHNTLIRGRGLFEVRGLIEKYDVHFCRPFLRDTLSIPIQFELLEQALDGGTLTYRLQLSEEPDVIVGLDEAIKINTRDLLKTIEKNIKWQLSLSLTFVKAANTEVVTDPPVVFLTEPVSSTSGDPVELQLKVALRRLWQQIDEYERNGSGWIIDRLVALDLRVYNHLPLRGSAHIQLEKKLRGKRGVLNIRNNDDDWYVDFLYAHRFGSFSLDRSFYHCVFQDLHCHV